MYCPQCGQQQISDSTRFCSRCGLLVSGLAEWLARGGVAPAGQNEAVIINRPPSPKKKGISRGAKLMFISGVLLPICFGMAVVVGGPGPLLLPATIFFAGLSILLYSVIFGEEIPIVTQPTEASRLSNMFRNTLPPATNNPMNRVTEQPVRTAELAGPPSVTENTTKLLDRD
ncbi:MAG: zinc ribbon domain-containing protein [Acidobacteriota bacterium]